MKRFMLIGIALLLMLLTACSYGAGRDSINRHTVSSLDLNSIMGKWYEIARFDHRFERGMEYVTATYTLQPDGTVEVKNQGMRGKEEHISIGHAKTTDEPGKLRVSFFWKFYSDYNILAIAPDGSWMIVGSSSPKYLWILSRTPTLPAKTLEYVTSLAAQRGYNTEKLIFVKQTND
ncbi:MAG: lipocalin family protein [Alistipes sp.]|nr:lipocalin family protein [Alistipes sp.]